MNFERLDFGINFLGGLQFLQWFCSMGAFKPIYCKKFDRMMRFVTSTINIIDATN